MMSYIPSTRRRTCCLCHQQKDTWECDYSTTLKATVCNACTTKHDSGCVNMTRLGRASKSYPAFSLEFEVCAPGLHFSQLERALLLIKYGFKRTVDTSVDDEYKSPIYQNLRVFYRPLMVLHTLRHLVTSDCGTHLHVTFRHKSLLQPIQESVFALLIAHMRSNIPETVRFWGRRFCDYARASSKDRYCCFNLHSQHNTIEYRLPRFRDAAQYLSVVHFCLRTTAYLDACLSAVASEGATIAPEQMACQVLSMYRHALLPETQRALLPASMKGWCTPCADSR